MALFGICLYIYFPQEEDEERKRRLEEEELAGCTFTPNTKWKLAAERRKKAREEAERAAEEASYLSRRRKISVSHNLRSSSGMSGLVWSV